MTKADLINLIAEEARITRVKAESVVNTIFDSMADALMKNERVEVRDFGIFTVRQYDAYTGRNPRNGAPPILIMLARTLYILVVTVGRTSASSRPLRNVSKQNLRKCEKH